MKTSGHYLQDITRIRNYLSEKFKLMKSGMSMSSHMELVFRDSPFLGPNALALPGGTIIVTDQLMELASTESEILTVIAHEIGHVELRHSLRQVLQSSAVGIAAATITGDAATLSAAVAGLPAVLVQTSYSRKFESEADAFAFKLLEQHNISPAIFASFMEKLEKARPERGLSFMSTHPLSSERIEKARMAAVVDVDKGKGHLSTAAKNQDALRTINLSPDPDMNCVVHSLSIPVVNQSTGKMFVSCSGKGIGVIDTPTLELESIIPFDVRARKIIDVDTVTNKVFVGHYLQGTGYSRLAFIDGTDHKVLKVIDVEGDISFILCDPARRVVHILCRRSLYSYDVNTLELKNKVAIAGLARAIPKYAFLSGSSGHIYLLTPRGQFREYDPVTGKMVSELKTDDYRVMAIDDEGGRIFLGRSGNPSGMLAVLDIGTGKTLNTLAVGRDITSLAYDGSLNEIYVLDRQQGQIYIVDSSSLVIKTQLTAPGSIIISDEARDMAYVIDDNTSTIRKINGSANHLQSSMPTGLSFSSIAVDHKDKKLFVLEKTEAKIYVLDAETGEIESKTDLNLVYRMNRMMDFKISAVDVSAGKLFIKGHNRTVEFDYRGDLGIKMLPVTAADGTAFDEERQLYWYAWINRIRSYDRNKKASQISVFKYPKDMSFRFMALDESGKRLYVSYQKKYPSREHGVAVVSAEDGSILQERQVRGNIRGLVADKGQVIVAKSVTTAGVSKHYLELLDSKTLKLKKVININTSPSRMTIDTKRRWLYAVYGNSVTVLDMNTGKEVKMIPTDKHPVSVAVDKNTGRAYVLNNGDISITVIN